MGHVAGAPASPELLATFAGNITWVLLTGLPPRVPVRVPTANVLPAFVTNRLTVKCPVNALPLVLLPDTGTWLNEVAVVVGAVAFVVAATAIAGAARIAAHAIAITVAAVLRRCINPSLRG